MAGREIAFLPYPAYGHMTPELPVVAELVRRGHRVTCLASDEFTERVRATGARVVGYGTELCTSSPDQLSADESARAPLRLLEETMATVPAIQRAFAGGPPDLLVYDTTLWAPGRLLARTWGVPTVQLSATVASNEHFSLTKEGQRFGPAIDPTHPALARFVTRLRDYLTDHDLGHVTLDEFFTGDDEYTVVFVPRRFQPAGDTFDDRYCFVGPTTTAPTGPTTWHPPASGHPVLLITLGTTVNDQPDFFRTCAEAFAGLPWHVVLTLGNRVDPAWLGPLPPNVEAHRWVPHAEVLRHASLFLCQGGMGSIMEALYFGTPVIAVPHHPEQKINAGRILQLGLGAVIERDAVSAATVRDTTLALSADDEVLGRVRVLRNEVRTAGGASRAADQIEARLLVRGRS
ncbi:MAG TPA: macrolide family glycosyltransferase [Pseudonocardiaceae bacterium]|nr:macrolide family glycosyltransferase [Pseudonocardiaceae bacterium]